LFQKNVIFASDICRIAMSAYRMEIDWAVDDQLEMLAEALKKVTEVEPPMIIRTKMSSAPMNDSLFDSLTLFVKIDEDGTAHFRGVITKFHLPEDDQYNYEFKAFPDFLQLKDWYFSTYGKGELCTDILCGPSNVK